MPQPRANAEHADSTTGRDSISEKQPWEAPVLDILPLSETLNTVGPGSDGTISGS